MAKAMKDPINLSIGLPDFDVPEPVKAAAIAAIEQGHNAYTVTQGIPELRTKLQAGRRCPVRPCRPPGPGHRGHLGRPAAGALLRGQSRRRGHHLRPLLRDVPAPGDPGRRASRSWSTPIPTSASMPPRSPRVVTDRTKCVVVNSPVNPTGIVATAEEMRALAELCRERGILLISDEVYRAFCYDHPFASPATWNEDVLVVDGFSKTLRHDRLAAGLCPRPEPPDPGDGQAPAVQLRLCPEHGPVRRSRRPRPGPDRPDRRLPPQARHGRRRPERRLRPRPVPKVRSTPSRAPRGAPPASSSPRRSRTTC